MLSITHFTRDNTHRGSHISTTTVHFGNYLPTCPHKDCNSVVDPLTMYVLFQYQYNRKPKLEHFQDVYSRTCNV